MNNEIKEILELFAFTDEDIMFGDIVELNPKQSHLLLDYITNLQEENKELKKYFESDMEIRAKLLTRIDRLNNIIKDIEEYVNFLVIFNQTINGRFSETIWGQEILDLIGSEKE